MGTGRWSRSGTMRLWAAAAAVVALVLLPQQAQGAGGTASPVTNDGGLTSAQRAGLMSIARDTWKFYGADVDATTHLPLDNLTFAGGSATPTSYGRYTSAANIGVYLWAVVAARDLGLISRPQARTRLEATLGEVGSLKRDNGFLYQWYDTTSGDVIRNPGDIDCTSETTPTFDNCFFISNVDNGWYAAGLIVVRQAMPELRGLVDSLMAPINFGLFYDGRAETHCNTNPGIAGNQPTGQMYGGYYVGLPPGQGDNWMHYYHNGAFYSDPRAQLAGASAARSVPGLPEHGPGLLLARAVADAGLLADLHRPAVRPAVQRMGRPLRLSRLRPDVHPHLRGRDVRGADAERGGARN